MGVERLFTYVPPGNNSLLMSLSISSIVKMKSFISSKRYVRNLLNNFESCH